MTPMKIKVLGTGEVDYIMLDRDNYTIYNKEGSLHLKTKGMMSAYLHFGEAEEVEMKVENFKFFSL